jgi:hypothetical protein
MVFRRGRRARSNATPTSCQDGETHSAALHRLAEHGMYDAILALVMNSTPADWDESTSQQPQRPAPAQIIDDDDSSAVEDRSDIDTPATAATDDAVLPSPYLEAATTSTATTTPLHLILPYQPPVEVVDSMIHLVHDRLSILSPEEYPDQEQKTPLHIAVEHFCDPEVIERLWDGESLLVPALLRDRLGRCALHYNLCTPIVRKKKKNLFDRDPVAMDQFRQRQTLSILLEHYPEAAGLTDVHGMTPWDYAVMRKMDGVYVRYLKTMYDVFALKPPKKFAKQMTNSSTTMDVSDFTYDENDDDEDISDDELPADLRSLNCSRHWKEEIDNDVSSVGDYEAELYNTVSLDDFDD